MRKIIVMEWITLDGVYDANTMETWFIPYHSDQRAKFIQDTIHGCDTYLLGRNTYEMLAPYWSSLKNNEMGIAEKLNAIPKVVVSSSMQESLWNNTSFIKEDIISQISALKKKEGAYILIAGSGTLVQTLLEARLIDEIRLLIHPVIMGAGNRFFNEPMNARLTLTQLESMPNGIMQCIYQPEK